MKFSSLINARPALIAGNPCVPVAKCTTLIAPAQDRIAIFEPETGRYTVHFLGRVLSFLEEPVDSTFLFPQSYAQTQIAQQLHPPQPAPVTRLKTGRKILL